MPSMAAYRQTLMECWYRYRSVRLKSISMIMASRLALKSSMIMVRTSRNSLASRPGFARRFVSFISRRNEARTCAIAFRRVSWEMSSGMTTSSVRESATYKYAMPCSRSRRIKWSVSSMSTPSSTMPSSLKMGLASRMPGLHREIGTKLMDRLTALPSSGGLYANRNGMRAMGQPSSFKSRSVSGGRNEAGDFAHPDRPPVRQLPAQHVAQKFRQVVRRVRPLAQRRIAGAEGEHVDGADPVQPFGLERLPADADVHDAPARAA